MDEDWFQISACRTIEYTQLQKCPHLPGKSQGSIIRITGSWMDYQIQFTTLFVATGILWQIGRTGGWEPQEQREDTQSRGIQTKENGHRHILSMPLLNTRTSIRLHATPWTTTPPAHSPISSLTSFLKVRECAQRLDELNIVSIALKLHYTSLLTNTLDSTLISQK